MTDTIAPLIHALHAQGRLRVWSLIITVFGDVVQPRRGEISTARLGGILGRVGVEPGAMRTALSRLGRDGWVTSLREGRLSRYRLSPQGVDRFGPATALIYAPPPDPDVTSWTLALRLGDNGVPAIDLRPEGEGNPNADLTLTGQLDHVSDAYRARLLDAPHRAALANLAADLATLRNPPPDPLDAIAARILLIHRWRRIVLRFPDIPPALMPADAPLADPRRAVAEAYVRLVPASESWLDAEDDALPPMPPADARFAKRFTPSHRA